MPRQYLGHVIDQAGEPGRRLLIRRLRTADLTALDVAALRTLLDEAFWPMDEEPFPESDWQHALGGVHIVAELEGRIVAHAAVVPRELHVAGRPLRTGYVEAVAVAPAAQRRGIGTGVMQPANEVIRATYELGALGTGEHGFYERLGWRTWQGPTFVRTPEGDRRTADEDGGIMVLETPSTPSGLDLGAPISCEWREGDVW
jgi:aminoglycoside 2'-N-acetyltransferase I